MKKLMINCTTVDVALKTQNMEKQGEGIMHKSMEPLRENGSEGAEDARSTVNWQRSYIFVGRQQKENEQKKENGIKEPVEKEGSTIRRREQALETHATAQLCTSASVSATFTLR
uniref:Uncharacterized protein n=1 Tax=Steinernema glaseri TaxID=37863 RepID=A0A1I7Y4C1_9BILA